MQDRVGFYKLSGTESIALGEVGIPTTVLGFWSWALSDVVSNTARGLLAEYLVACDLGVTDSLRVEWEPFDLTSRGGVRVEVKSSAYVQRWEQKRARTPSFSIAPTRFWDAEVGDFVGDKQRQADVYVFCLLAHRDRATVNPLDVRQWRFFAAPTRLLDRHLGAQKSAALSTLERIGVKEVAFGAIDAAIEELASASGAE